MLRSMMPMAVEEHAFFLYIENIYPHNEELKTKKVTKHRLFHENSIFLTDCVSFIRI